MATIDKTFSKTTFDYKAYAAVRPSYPPTLVDLVLAQCTGPRENMLDLGCGHGVSTRTFAAHFTHATGADPSDGMLAAAASLPTAANIAWAKGTSTALPRTIQPHSLDLVTSSQAAHWFPQRDTLTALAAAVKPGGTLAFWGYADVHLPDSSAASDAVHAWLWGPRPGSLGPHWVQPGRTVIEALYAEVAAAAARHPDWSNVRWVRRDPRAAQAWFAGESRVQPGAEAVALEEAVADAEREALAMRKRMRVAELKALARTWSAYDWWREAHPADVPRALGGSGDVADWMMDEVAGIEPRWASDDAELLVDWPVGLVLATRAAL